MNLRELRGNWNKLGEVDPLWAICTFAEKRGNRWDLREFFETGENEISDVLGKVAELGVELARRRALDFGCGAGRLTQALANYFERVDAVDIAPSMIRIARKYNRHGDRCRFFLNEADDLALFADNSFDFIYSNITLQHMDPSFSKNYLREFLRTLDSRGLLVFQLPSHEYPRDGVSRGPVAKAKELVKSLAPECVIGFYKMAARELLGRAEMEMHGIAQEEVVAFLEQHGGKVIHILQDEYAGPYWESFRYFVIRRV